MATGINLLPPVVIEKILLESNARRGEKVRDNPHINEERTTTVAKDSLTGKTIGRANVLGDIIYNESSVNGETTVTVNFLVKDVHQGPGNKPLWVSNEFIKKFIAINLVVSRSDLTTTNLMLRQDKIEKIIKEHPFQEKSNGSVRVYKKYLNENEVIGNDPIYGNPYRSFDTTLRRYVYNVPYAVRFTIPEGQKDLTFIAFTSIDLGPESQIVQDLGVNPDNFDVVYSPPLIESVLKNGNASSHTTYFVDQVGNAYDGPYHYMPPTTDPDTGALVSGVYMSGQSHGANSILLRKKKIATNKISDMRKIDRVTTSSTINFSSFEDLVSNLNRKFKLASEKPLYVDGKISFFSKLYPTIAQTKGSETFDSDGKKQGVMCNMFFVLDWRKLLKQNTIFSSLLDFPSGDDQSQMEKIENIFRKSKILSFKVFRKRVTRQTTIGSKTLFDIYDEAPKLIVSTADNKGENGLLSKTHYETLNNILKIDGSIEPKAIENNQQILMGSVREIKGVRTFDGTHSGMRFFTITDSQIQNESYGTYKYYVEMKIKNGAFDYLREKHNNLMSNLNKLSTYYNSAIKGDGSGGGSFDLITGRFSDRFINLYASSPGVYLDAIDSFLRCAQILYRESDEFLTIEPLKQKLSKMCAPTTGTPGGIELVKNIIDQFASSLGRIIGNNISLNKDSLDVNVNDTKKNTISKRVFDVFYEFDNFEEMIRLDQTTTRNGYEFLASRQMPSTTMAIGQDATSTRGLKTVTEADFKTRNQLEITKYLDPNIVGRSDLDAITLQYGRSTDGTAAGDPLYEPDVLSINEDLSMKFFTPSAVKYSGHTYDILEGFYSRKRLEYNEIKHIARDAVLSLSETVLAGSHDNQKTSVSIYEDKTVKQTDEIKRMTEHIKNMNLHLDLLEHFNCVVSGRFDRDLKDYILSSKQYSEDRLGGSPFESPTPFTTDDEGNEIINPLYERQYLSMKEGKKYTLSRIAATDNVASNEVIENILKREIFPANNENPADYDISNLNSRIIKTTPLRDDDKGRYVKNLPLPLVSMLMINSQDVPTAQAAQIAKRTGSDYNSVGDFSYNWMFYKNIVCVEFLSSFNSEEAIVTVPTGEIVERRIVKTHVNSLAWEKVTPVSLNNLKSLGATSVLCRFRRYYNKDFNVYENQLTQDIPILNEYFVINLTSLTSFAGAVRSYINSDLPVPLSTNLSKLLVATLEGRQRPFDPLGGSSESSPRNSTTLGASDPSKGDVKIYE